MKNLSAGIDFGTTNSSAAIPINGNPTLVPLENKNITIPTAMYFMNDGVIHFGRSAVDNYTANETSGRFMRSIKRILGSPLMKSSGTQVGSDVLKFDKIIETFVRHLKEKIDAAAGANVENVVMGRPVHFRENDAAGDMRAQE
ncbi:MAG: Hsp70 family protein, partial [Alphaproteobacteria bacterium]|nr:Hsp70 family protein [Alphaproteobacteria bacterium]